MTFDAIELRRVTLLDAEIVPLVVEAEGDSHRFLRRLLDEWNSGTNRFAGDGELLLSAHVDDRLVAIGGLNRDPYVAAHGVARLRHVYVSSNARRLGVGSVLVKRLIEDARENFDVMRLRTMTAEAAAFYERLGFQRADGEAVTHVLSLRP